MHYEAVHNEKWEEWLILQHNVSPGNIQTSKPSTQDSVNFSQTSASLLCNDSKELISNCSVPSVSWILLLESWQWLTGLT